MASISTQNFVTLVQNQVAYIQGTAKVLVDFTIGSILRAIAEANAGVVLWLQGLILQVLALTRAATSSGSDLDTFVADYGLSRLSAVASTGQVTFSRFTATLRAVVPVGATVQSTDGAQQFTVTLDTANGAYSAGDSGYVLAAGISSVTVPVMAVTAGAGANVSAGQVTVMTQAIPGVDTVTNTAAYTNGEDAETDTALRLRFRAYIASLSKATKGAIGYAITSVSPEATYTLVENQQYNGASDYGYFYAVVDDGTGYPTSIFLSSVANAIEAVRGFGLRYGVFAPVVVTANIAMTITTDDGYDHNAVVAAVSSALQAYINSLTLGQALAYSRLAQVAYDASPGVINVTSVAVNGGTADISATSKQVIKSGLMVVA